MTQYTYTHLCQETLVCWTQTDTSCLTTFAKRNDCNPHQRISWFIPEKTWTRSTNFPSNIPSGTVSLPDHRQPDRNSIRSHPK